MLQDIFNLQRDKTTVNESDQSETIQFDATQLE